MKLECPLPKYWMCHIAVALLIAAVVAAGLWYFIGVWSAYIGLALGAGFYTARELIQWRSGLPFDWPGLLAPVSACLGMFSIVLAAALML